MNSPQLRTVQTPIQRSVIYNGLKDGHGEYLIVNFTAANADKVIAHSLGRTPVGYWPVRRKAGGGLISDGTNAGSDWSVSSVVLQASVVGVYTIFLI